MSLSVLPIFLGVMTFFYVFLALRIGYMRGKSGNEDFFQNGRGYFG